MEALYQTGANTHAVNDLLLFTDNTRLLIEMRDSIYQKMFAYLDQSPMALETKFFSNWNNLHLAAIREYKKCFPDYEDHCHLSHVNLLSGKPGTWTDDQIREYVGLYLSDYKNWLAEHDYTDWEGNVTPPIMRLTVLGNDILLPKEQWSRDVYVDIKSKLENIGGKYNTRIKGFSFKSDPTALLERLQAGEQVNIKQEFQFFETPSRLAERIVELADIQEEHDVLEPSAGRGAIVKQLPIFRSLDVCELFEENAKYLQSEFRVPVIASDFLSIPSKEHYDRIVANPPFSGNQDIDHIRKMYSVLKPGGRIVSIASTSWTFGSHKKQVEFRQWLDELGAHWEEVPENTFKESGTSVRTTLIIIDKAA